MEMGIMQFQMFAKCSRYDKRSINQLQEQLFKDALQFAVHIHTLGMTFFVTLIRQWS
jgi:hypothetical protein